MKEEIFFISVMYLIFSFITMNGVIVQCFLDNTVRPTIKKGMVAFVLLLLLMILDKNVDSGWLILLFMYIIYPTIIVWEKQKSISTYKSQLFTFIGCELVALIGNFAMIYSAICGLVEFSASGITVVAILVGCLYNLISIRLYIKYIKQGISMMCGRNEGIMIFIYIVIALFSVINNTMSLFYTSYIAGIYFQKSISVILLIMIPILMKKDREGVYYTEQSLKNAHFLQMQLMAYNTYREAQEDTRAFRHDINNNLAVIGTLMQEKKYDEAERYINELSGNIKALSPKIITGDDMLDTLLLSKFALIKNNSINLTIKGVIAGGLGWKAIDVCTVFSNLIDNAVEACQKIDDNEVRYIEINFKHTDYQRIISIRNSVSDVVYINKNNNLRYTTKNDKNNHGYGMKNIKYVIEKNNAMLEIKCDKKFFETNIIIMK